MASKVFSVGDTVRLTGAFLRSTGQYAGSEGLARWTVQAVSKDGRIVTTNEPRADDGTFTREEIAADPELGFRHVHAGNLELCRGAK